MKSFYFKLFPLYIFSQAIFYHGLISQTPSLKEGMYLDKSANNRDTQKYINPWNWQVVYSDRNLNPVYKTPGDDEPSQFLTLLSQYLIKPNTKDGEDCYLVLVVNTKGNYNYFKKDTSVGWVNCNNLLKGEQSFRTPDSLFFLKAAIINNIYNTDSISYRSNYFYSEPELINFTEHEAKRLSIFYIYKRNQISVLLGKKERFTSEKTGKEIILGWYPSSRILPLNNQIFLEPNWEEEAVKERKLKNIKPQLFFYEYDAIRFRKGEKTNSRNIFWLDDSDKRTLVNKFPPLLLEEGCVNDIVKVTAIRDAHPCFYQKVFTPLKHEQLNYPLYKFVFLLSSIELSEFIKNIKEILINSFVKSDCRESIKKNYMVRLKEINNTYHDNDINLKTISDANREIFGYPLMGNTIGSFQIYQIVESIDTAKIAGFIDRTKKSYEKLTHILNNNEYVYNWNDVNYFWISENDLP